MEVKRVSKRQFTICMDPEMHTKLLLYSYAYEEVYGEKRSVSSMVNDAMRDYIEKHKDEFLYMVSLPNDKKKKFLLDYFKK